MRVSSYKSYVICLIIQMFLAMVFKLSQNFHAVIIVENVETELKRTFSSFFFLQTIKYDYIVAFWSVPD